MENRISKYFYIIFGAFVLLSLFLIFYSAYIEYPKMKKYDYLVNEFGEYNNFKNLKIKGIVKYKYGNGKYGIVIGVKPEVLDTVKEYKYRGCRSYIFDNELDVVFIYLAPRFLYSLPNELKNKRITKNFGEVEFSFKNSPPIPLAPNHE